MRESGLPIKEKPASREVLPRRVLLTGDGAEEAIGRELLDVGFQLVEQNDAPDFVIAYGGDGSLLGADREFPDLPKLAIRRNHSYVKCHRHENAQVFHRIFSGNHSVTFLHRLEAEVNGRFIRAINDIVFHNQNVTSAVRYLVRIDGEPCGGEIVGDGLVAATPFGSTAYYRSITNSVFRVGLGVAFNNSTESVNHMVLDPTSVIEVEVTRGPALAVGDNLREPAEMQRGDVLKIRYGSQLAEIWELSTITCMDCRHRTNNQPAGFRHV